ncbi:CLC_0170 family protein [Paenibacillus sp. S150]|uniref:CLC_0170 family protein n=1 Tax=Paenibacillus sp. S150 TaxID=2749826 RepID=UPI001C5640CA|nr:CLC_0170 family protein [Paenibacillus sp. S150]MBW4084064.1 hypothetical protein [Paenibacillus sp. S150]
MVRLFACTAAIIMFSALLLLTVDRNIYQACGRVREKNYASALGWGYAAISLLIIVFLIIFL